jgi:hypothetical protein
MPNVALATLKRGLAGARRRVDGEQRHDHLGAGDLGQRRSVDLHQAAELDHRQREVGHRLGRARPARVRHAQLLEALRRQERIDELARPVHERHNAETPVLREIDARPEQAVVAKVVAPAVLERKHRALPPLGRAAGAALLGQVLDVERRGDHNVVDALLAVLVVVRIGLGVARAHAEHRRAHADADHHRAVLRRRHQRAHLVGKRHRAGAGGLVHVDRTVRRERAKLARRLVELELVLLEERIEAVQDRRERRHLAVGELDALVRVHVALRRALGELLGGDLGRSSGRERRNAPTSERPRCATPAARDTTLE